MSVLGKALWCISTTNRIAIVRGLIEMQHKAPNSFTCLPLSPTFFSPFSA